MKTTVIPKYTQVNLNSILLAISVSLISLFPRTNGISAGSIFNLALIVLGIMFFTIAGGFILGNLHQLKILLPFVSIILLIGGLLFFDHDIATIGLQLVIGLVTGGILGRFWRSGEGSLLISWGLLVVFVALPTILWPRSISNSVFLATVFLISVIVSAYGFFSLSPNHAATYRLFVYNFWLIFLVHVALGFTVGFWGTVLVMGFGAGIIFAVANSIEDRQTQRHWRTSQVALWESRWAIMSATSPTEASRMRLIRTLPQIVSRKNANASIIDTNLWLTGRSLRLHQEIDGLLNSFAHNFLIKNPKAAQVAQEALLDLPIVMTKQATYLYLEQWVWLDLIQDLQQTEGGFDQNFISNTWLNYSQKRNQAIDVLRKSGELTKRLNMLPHHKIIPPYSPNGVFLDYGNWPEGKPDLDWETMFQEDLSPTALLDETSPGAIQKAEQFLDWISQIKKLRDRLSEMISSRNEEETWQNNLKHLCACTDRGFEETLAFVDYLQQHQLYFEAIDLLEALGGYYNDAVMRKGTKQKIDGCEDVRYTSFIRKRIEDKIAECEINRFIQTGWAQPVELKIERISSHKQKQPQLRILNNARYFSSMTTGYSVTSIPLHILLSGSTAHRISLDKDQTTTIPVSPGNYIVFVYPRNIHMPPVQTRWSVDDANSVYDLSMELLAPTMRVPQIVFNPSPPRRGMGG